SIPLWCDWDRPIRHASTLPPRSFNPTVVRLGLNTLAGVQLYVPAFNPTVVRLGPECKTRFALLEPTLSIPLWCDWDEI
ncbi:MAG: hypothetical protein RMK89_14555, partial [Armatimonadota bacterium]|nr:hypothetical protein [Armatimonadota bacterium]MDW8144665.1 hypothetical protein [Armatimonadota bacterium]